MGRSNRGFEYERDVMRALCDVGLEVACVAGASAADADVSIPCPTKGRKLDIEVKLNADAQLGGTSFRYRPGVGFEPVGGMFDDESTASLLPAVLDALEERADAFDALIEFLDERSVFDVRGFPATVEKEVWVDAVDAGLVRATNVIVEVDDMSPLYAHYAKKGVYYIQVGGMGLYWMAANPLDLPIPRLEGRMRLEIRPARSGSRVRRGHDGEPVRVVSVNLRVQGRMSYAGARRSTIDLDDPRDVEVFAELFRDACG